MRQLPVENLGTPPLTSAAAFLWWQARQQWGLLLTSVLLGILALGASAVLPYAIGQVLDAGLDHGIQGPVLHWAGVMAIAAAVQVVIGMLGHRVDVQCWMRASFAASELIGNKVADSGEAITEELPTGEVVSAVANDALRMGEAFMTLGRFVGSIVIYIAVSIVMLRGSLPLGLILSVGLPVVAVILALMVKPLQRQQSNQREAQGRLTSLGADTVSGLRILRGIGGESVFSARYRDQSQVVRAAGNKVAKTQSFLDGLQILLPGLLVVMILWVGARAALGGSITPGMLVTFYGFAAFLTWPLQIITESMQFFTRSNIAARKVLKVLNVARATASSGAALPSDAQAFLLVDEATGIAVKPGVVTALVSEDPDESAAIATRLGRFDDAAEADTPVQLGPNPIAQFELAAFRNHVVVGEATPHIFAGALRDGLNTRAMADDETLLAALHVADAQDVLDSIPGGLDGELPEKGRALSGGQRQRVALARALLTDAPVLVLIEPTSAVDAHTEARIAQRLTAARHGRATLIVTASPLVLDQVDEVLVVRDGKIVASGTHVELLERSDEGAQHFRLVVGRSMEEAQS